MSEPDITTLTCPVCGDVFPSAEELLSHTHDQPLAWERGSSPFECPTCGVTFDEMDQLVTHQSQTHPDA